MTSFGTMVCSPKRVFMWASGNLSGWPSCARFFVVFPTVHCRGSEVASARRRSISDSVSIDARRADQIRSTRRPALGRLRLLRSQGISAAARPAFRRRQQRGPVSMQSPVGPVRAYGSCRRARAAGRVRARVTGRRAPAPEVSGRTESGVQSCHAAAILKHIRLPNRPDRDKLKGACPAGQMPVGPRP